MNNGQNNEINLEYKSLDREKRVINMRGNAHGVPFHSSLCTDVNGWQLCLHSFAIN